jgi:hypothetical protein
MVAEHLLVRARKGWRIRSKYLIASMITLER